MIRSIRKILIGVLLMCTTFIILCKTELSPHEKPVDVVSKGVYGVVDDKPIAKLTQLQKEEYYKQYAEIIDVVTNGSLYGVELAPIGDFKPEDWVTPSKFERIARERANTRIVFKIRWQMKRILMPVL